MHHLFLTRKAASSITSAMRYYMAKKRNKITTAQATHTSNQSNSNIRSTVMQSFNSPQIGGRANGGDINWTLDLEEELMISERVEA